MTRSFSINVTPSAPPMLIASVVETSWQGRRSDRRQLSRFYVRTRGELERVMLSELRRILEQSGWELPHGAAGTDPVKGASPPSAHANGVNRDRLERLAAHPADRDRAARYRAVLTTRGELLSDHHDQDQHQDQESTDE